MKDTTWLRVQHAGITYVVLKYRMPNGHKEVPFSEVEQAIRLVRQHAAEWNINPAKVGIMGASALAAPGPLTLVPHYT
jgi:acetyl esterase/lipase